MSTKHLRTMTWKATAPMRALAAGEPRFNQRLESGERVFFVDWEVEDDKVEAFLAAAAGPDTAPAAPDGAAPDRSADPIDAGEPRTEPPAAPQARRRRKEPVVL